MPTAAEHQQPYADAPLLVGQALQAAGQCQGVLEPDKASRLLSQRHIVK